MKYNTIRDSVLDYISVLLYGNAQGKGMSVTLRFLVLLPIKIGPYGPVLIWHFGI